MKKRTLIVNGVIYRFHDLETGENLIEVCMQGFVDINDQWATATVVVPNKKANAIYKNLYNYKKFVLCEE